MIQWYQKTFSVLTNTELYSILQFRIGIFMLEQKNLYTDLDGEDQSAMHFLGIEENNLIAYERVNKKGDIAEIRRVCVIKPLRKKVSDPF